MYSSIKTSPPHGSILTLIMLFHWFTGNLFPLIIQCRNTLTVRIFSSITLFLPNNSGLRRTSWLALVQTIYGFFQKLVHTHNCLTDDYESQIVLCGLTVLPASFFGMYSRRENEHRTKRMGTLPTSLLVHQNWVTVHELSFWLCDSCTQLSRFHVQYKLLLRKFQCFSISNSAKLLRIFFCCPLRFSWLTCLSVNESTLPGFSVIT